MVFKECEKCVAKSFCRMYSGERKLKNIPPFCSSHSRLYASLKLSELPKNRWEDNMFNFIVDKESKQVYDAIKKYVQRVDEFVDKGMNALFTGNGCGVGKTFTACCMLNHYIYKTCFTTFDYEHPSATYAEFSKVIDEMRYRRHEDSVRNWFKQLQTVDLLVLDDVGTVVQTDFMLEQTYILLNSRIENNKSTIITTNLSEEKLKGYIGSRRLSRILNKCIVLDFKSKKDRRKDSVQRLI